jgi:hypothetical protein
MRGGMNKMVRRRFWVELASASGAWLLAIVTLSWPDWIEALSGWSPDHGNGSVELLILAATISLALLSTAGATLAGLRVRAVHLERTTLHLTTHAAGSPRLARPAAP